MALYTIITKVGKDQFVKYRNVSNLIRFTSFLDNKFPTWKYFNVYDKSSKKQIASFTVNNRPTLSKI